MTTNNETKEQVGYFRIPVQPDCSDAVIRVGRRKMNVTVQETSIDGFTILVSKKEARKLSVGDSWVLLYDATRLEVHAEWFFNSPDGQVQIGLRRLRDLTPLPKIGNSLVPSLSLDQRISSISPLAYGGFVLVLFLAMALPGLGDQLGTASRIQGAAKWLLFATFDAFAR